MGLLLLMSVTLEYSGLTMQHHPIFFQAMCATVPATLALCSRASGKRFAATAVAGIYTVFMLGFLWILPLFPAEPKLGPVYHQVTHFVPAGFPLLLILPALALDLFWGAFPRMNDWLRAAISGVIFLSVFLAAQWPFASFLQSPAARNGFFGADDFDYLTGPGSMIARHVFYAAGTPAELATGLAWAALWAMLAVRLGLSRGSGLREVKR
jgi:hypothetical protein